MVTTQDLETSQGILQRKLSLKVQQHPSETSTALLIDLRKVLNCMGIFFNQVINEDIFIIIASKAITKYFFKAPRLVFSSI